MTQASSSLGLGPASDAGDRFSSECFWPPCLYRATGAREQRRPKSASFVPTWKPYSTGAASNVGAGGRQRSRRRDVAHVHSQLWRRFDARPGNGIRDLVVTTPVDAYESYRASLPRSCGRSAFDAFGSSTMWRRRRPDTALPEAARRLALVVDFEAERLMWPFVALDGAASPGLCEVIAKEGRQGWRK